MLCRIISLLLTVSSSISCWAQVGENPLPDIPGSFVVDFGFNRVIYKPNKFDEDFWGSRTCNVYYQYPIRLNKSKFSFVPALGLSMERFKLSNNHTLSPQVLPDGSRSLVDVGDTFNYSNIVKSMIITNYVDFPIGFRFDTNPDDSYRSFHVSMGMRIGVLYESFTKIKYQEGDEFKINKHTQRYGLNLFRYGAYIRLGVAAFNVFFVYNISPYFEPGKGPDGTIMTTCTFGISLMGL